MKQGIRESMIWLHTWSSLLLGWLLFAVFLTGTIAFFQVEVSHWMKPEQHASAPSEKSLDVGLDYLGQIAPQAKFWQINLPDERSRTLGVSWENPDEQPQRRRGPRQIIDASTGEPIDSRETRGGGFLYRFHFELYHLPRGTARWIVGIASMMMFVGLMTGLFTRRKLFAQFFTFRPKRNAMSWIDAHVVTGLMALPFHIMITLSGLMLFANTCWSSTLNLVKAAAVSMAATVDAANNNSRSRTCPAQPGHRISPPCSARRNPAGAHRHRTCVSKNP